MKIISGELKGRRLSLPKGSKIRPVTSGVLEQVMSLFTSKHLALGAFVDICAGSGIVGLEAISRGAPETVFVEADPATGTRIKLAAAQFGVRGRTTVMTTDARRCFKRIPKLLKQSSGVAAVFLDPPFINGLAHDLIDRLGRNAAFLLPGAKVILRTPDKIPESIIGLNLVQTRKAGKAVLYIFEPMEENND